MFFTVSRSPDILSIPLEAMSRGVAREEIRNAVLGMFVAREVVVKSLFRGNTRLLQFDNNHWQATKPTRSGWQV